MNLKGLQFVDMLYRTHLSVSLNTIKNKIKDVKGEGAQITIDYVAGMSIFLLTVAFVFQFMYGLFTPFQSGSEEVTLAADRASTILVERMLVADGAGAMSVIDQGKLIYFNNTKLNVSNQTSYTNTLRELGLFSKESVFDLNISVANLTYPNNPMQSGPELPDNLDIGQTRRFVLIVNTSTGYKETAIISVRVW
jgi:hypothetical protein